MRQDSRFGFYRHPLVLLTLGSTLLLKAVSFLCLPFMTLYLLRRSGLQPPTVGLLVGFYQLGSVLAALVSGILADRLGRRRILLIGLAGSTAALFLLYVLSAGAYATTAFAAGFACINLLFGASAAFFWPVSQAMMADNLMPHQKSMAFQHRYMLANLGSAIGPLIGAALGVSSNEIAFAIAGALYLTITVLFWTITRRSTFQDHVNFSNAPRIPIMGSIALLGSDRALRNLVLACFFFNVAYSQIASNLSRFVAPRFADGMQFYSELLALNVLCVIGFQPIVSIVSKHAASRQCMLVGAAVFALACFAPPAQTQLQFAVLIAAISFGEVLLVPMSSVAVDELAPASMRATYFGAATLQNLGLAAGPAIGAAVSVSSGLHALLLFMAVCGVATFAMIMGMHRGAVYANSSSS